MSKDDGTLQQLSHTTGAVPHTSSAGCDHTSIMCRCATMDIAARANAKGAETERQRVIKWHESQAAYCLAEGNVNDDVIGTKRQARRRVREIRRMSKSVGVTVALTVTAVDARGGVPPHNC